MKLLIVDDSRLWCEMASSYLERDGFDVVTAGTLREARRHFDDPPRIVILDQKLPDGEGLTLAEEMMEEKLDTRILVITGHPRLDDAVQALRLRIDDYLTKPVELEVVRHAVLRSRESLRLERLDALQQRKSESDRASVRLVGDGLAEVRDLAIRLGAADCPVLITGPTGSGKSLVAKTIHYARGIERPFVKLNCAALPESLVESELFGVEKGAFTGADSRRAGLFELAHGGTLFLDEIGELSPAVQAKLLGVLEDGEARRVGGSAVQRFDVRVVAATHLNLEMALRENSFRSDLYYRLNIGRLEVPPLRDRIDDLPDLVEALLEGLRAGHVDLPPAELEALSAYDWPGNVRELRNVLERAILVHDSTDFRPSRFLPDRLRTVARELSTNRPVGPPAKTELPIATLEELEQEHIRRALALHGGHRRRTADALGIGVSTLRRKLRNEFAT